MDTEKIRTQFPFLKNNPNLVYLDNAATSQKPQSVLDAINAFYINHNGNPGRANHRLSREATAIYENARKSVTELILASSVEEIIFTKNSTEGLNFIAHSLGNLVVQKGDYVLTTQSEHHSNLLPWQELCRRKGAKLDFIPITTAGELDYLQTLESLKEQPVKLISLPYISNIFGVINPVRKIVEQVRRLWPQALIILDASQAAGHIPINLDHLKVDFIVFSGHKIYGPLGIGIVWGRKELLKQLQPIYLGGGSTIDADLNNFQMTRIPHCFEAGTVNTAAAAGLTAAIQFLNKTKIEKIQDHERELSEYLLTKLLQASFSGLEVYGPGSGSKIERIGLVSLNIDEIAAEDLSAYLDDDNIMVRAGNHCAIPTHKHVLKKPTSLRISFGVYNTQEEIDRLIESLHKATTILR